MTAAKEKPAVLGSARCPLCGGIAHVKLSGSGFAYLAMDCCKAQLFARGPSSDEHLRDLIGTAPAAKAKAPAATPAPSPAPAAQAPAPKAPAPTPEPSPAPAVTPPTAARDSAGTLLSHWFK